VASRAVRYTPSEVGHPKIELSGSTGAAMRASPKDGAVVYRINDDDVIVFVNDQFRDFAVRNEAAPLEHCVGKPLWSFIADWDTKAIYRLLVDRVRDGKLGPRFPFRCDSPALRRFMEMEITLLGDLIEFRCRLDRAESRDPVAPRQVDNEFRLEELVRMCSWCKRIQHPSSRWLDIDDAVTDLSLLATDEPPAITHGICGACYADLKTFLP
jgi:hypothetical protein